VAKFRKNTGKRTLDAGSGEETTAEKGHHFAEAMTKKVVSFFREKIG